MDGQQRSDLLDSETLLIASDTKGIELALHHKCASNVVDPPGALTVLLVHGATYASESLYGVPLGGDSVMDILALYGFDVYALDVRGYGRSTRPPEMSLPPEAHSPLVRTETAIRDFAAAVEYILVRNASKRLNLFAMSWGGTIAGAYTSRNNSNVHKLAMLAPQWISNEPLRLDVGGPLHAYRTVTPSAALKNWLAGVPEAKKADLIPQGWFDEWVKATLASGREQYDLPDSIRIPAGAVLDVREYWANGKPFYDPAEITVPVLLLHPEWDQDVPIRLALEYFQQLRSAKYKRMEAAPGAAVEMAEQGQQRCSLQRIWLTRSSQSSTCMRS